jgi:hypothetical protein
MVTPALDAGDVKAVKRIADTSPECTVQNGVLRCALGTIPARSTATTAVYARFGAPPSGKICIDARASATGISPALYSLCFTAAHYAQPDIGTGYTKGTFAHNLRLPDKNGNAVSLASFKGKYVFLQFDSVWCGPSNVTVPNDKQDISQLNSTNAMGVKIVYMEVLIDGPHVSVPSTRTDAQHWASTYHLTGPVLYSALDASQIAFQELLSYSIAAQKAGAAYPTAVFIDPQGKIFDLRQGGENHPGNTKQRFLNHLSS